MNVRRSFAFLLSARFCANLARQIQLTVVEWEIYQRTKDPFALGLIGLVIAVPFILSSLWAGHIVDRHDKRRLMIGSELALSVCALSFVAITFWTAAPVFFLYLVVALIGFCISFESISYSAFTQMLIPKAQYPKAAAWNLIVFQAAVILGPVTGGWLLTHANARAGFATSLGGRTTNGD